MRVVVFANNAVGLAVTRWLKDRGDAIVAVVVHPEGAQRFTREIVDASGVPANAVFDGATLGEPAVLAMLGLLQPDIGVSAFFGHILRRPLLDLFAEGVVNLHPSYLPYNRGHSPNIWAIVDRTPAGVALHYVDTGVDTGDIIARRVVPVAPDDTGETLYRRLEQECVRLFSDAWPDIVERRAVRVPQPASSATTHRRRDLDDIDHIDLDATYTARELIDVLRARTFPPFKGAYFDVGDRRIYMELHLSSEKIEDAE